MNPMSDALPRPSTTVYYDDESVELRKALLATPSHFRRHDDETSRGRKHRTEKINPLRSSNKAAASSMESSHHATKCTMPLICTEVAHLFDMDTSDKQEIDSFMENALKDEESTIDDSGLGCNAQANENISSKPLKNPSTPHKLAASSSTRGTYSEDIDAAVESQEKKLMATMKKSAASRAALKRYGPRSTCTKGVDHTLSAMTRSNATKNLLFRNARCSSKPNEMRSSKRQKVAKYTANEARYDSIIAAACLIMGGRQ